MKKIAFFLTSLLISVIGFAQQPLSSNHLTPLPANFKWVKAPMPNPISNDRELPQKIQSTSSSVRDADETIIGTTQYDLQTNRSIGNRFIRNSDGTLIATWTTLCPGGNSATDRGTGYNYFDGTSWLTPDCHKIEPTQRTGWPNIGVTSSGKEIVIAHSSTNGGMLLTSRTTKGSGAWTENGGVLGNNANDTWARMVVGGATGKTVHAIWNPSGSSGTSYCGQVSPVVYSRSNNQGVSWPILGQCLDLIGPSYYLGFGADNYSIDAQGDNVAILVGDFTTDLVLLKSTDNGNTWTKTIIVPFPIPFYDPSTMTTDIDGDGVGDILNVPDGDGRVAFDRNGMLHIVFSGVNVVEQFAGDGISYYPDIDGGLWYWNESMGSNLPVLIAAAQDLNGDGILNYPTGDFGGSHYGSGTYGGGLTIQPTIGFDDANNIYVAYATYDELSDTAAYGAGHRHVYYVSSANGGVSWSTPTDVVPSIAQGGDGENQEAVFPCIASAVDDKVRIIYQRDPAPGTSLSNTPDEISWNTYENDIVYVESPLCAVSTPTGLTSNVTSPTKAVLSWSPDFSASKFSIRYQSSNGNWLVYSNTNSRILKDLTPSTKYGWQVRAYCGGSAVANASPWSEKAVFQTNPVKVELVDNSPAFEVYPNPFSSNAIISFTLDKSTTVSLELYTIDGKKVITVANKQFPEGENKIPLDRNSLSAGVYVLRITMNDNFFLQKLVVE